MAVAPPDSSGGMRRVEKRPLLTAHPPARRVRRRRRTATGVVAAAALVAAELSREALPNRGLWRTRARPPPAPTSPPLCIVRRVFCSRKRIHAREWQQGCFLRWWALTPSAGVAVATPAARRAAVSLLGRRCGGRRSRSLSGEGMSHAGSGSVPTGRPSICLPPRPLPESGEGMRGCRWSRDAPR